MTLANPSPLSGDCYSGRDMVGRHRSCHDAWKLTAAKRRQVVSAALQQLLAAQVHQAGPLQGVWTT
jgi:hypothetical protein